MDEETDKKLKKRGQIAIGLFFAAMLVKWVGPSLGLPLTLALSIQIVGIVVAIVMIVQIWIARRKG